jgi:hypothetical protein
MQMSTIARMLGRLARVLLVFAVLLAQQTALAHQYWHASKSLVSADAKKPVKSDWLCDLHDLLGTVLGAAAGSAQTPAFLALGESIFSAPPTPMRDAPAPAPHSRDPPLIS